MVSLLVTGSIVTGWVDAYSSVVGATESLGYEDDESDVVFAVSVL